MMRKPRRNNALVHALYVNAALLAVIVVVLLTRGSSTTFIPTAAAQQAPIAGGAGIFVMPAQFSTNTWGCYLLDVDMQTLVAYQFYPGDKLLRLVAARNFKHDRRLENFNTAISPLEVKAMLDKQARSERVTGEAMEPVAPVEPQGAPAIGN